MISVIIPNHNGEKTIGACLERMFASNAEDFEVIVVDDCSSDGSIAIIEGYPCRLIRLARRSGAGRARNVGAAKSRGAVLFFTDADCLVREDTIARAAAAVAARGPAAVVGGTYTAVPADKSFYSSFQSLFVKYHETRECSRPDYIAAHAMVLERRTFERSGGFREDFLPVAEDVEFSHRLKEGGCALSMDPGIETAHIFGFNLWKSMKNAFRKTYWWTLFSMENGDLLADSGTASRGLKLNFLLQTFCLGALTAALLLRSPWPAWALVPALAVNASANAGLLRFFFAYGGKLFGLRAAAYYFGLFAFAVGGGAVAAAATMARHRAGTSSAIKWRLQHSGMSDR